LIRRHENGLVSSALRASPLDRLSATKLPQPKYWLGPSGLAIRLFRRLCKKTTQMWARPYGPRLSSVAPGSNFSPPRRPPRSLGRAALDSDHECEGVSYIDSVYRNPTIGTGHWGNIWNAKYLEIHQKFFLETFRVFSPYHSGPPCKKIRVGHRWNFWARGCGRKIFDPYISSNFGSSEPKFFGPIEIQEYHFHFEFQDPNPKIGAWGDDHRNKKIAFFDKKRIFQVKWQKRVLKLGKFWVSRFVNR